MSRKLLSALTALTLVASVLSATALSSVRVNPTPPPDEGYQLLQAADLGELAPEIRDQGVIESRKNDLLQELETCSELDTNLPGAHAAISGCLGENLLNAVKAGLPATVAASALFAVTKNDVRLAGPCHSVGHTFGKFSYRARGMDAFGPNLADCGFGYYHGLLEGMGDKQEIDLLISTSREVCNPYTDDFMYRQCLHGVGHAVSHGVPLEESKELCYEIAGKGDLQSSGAAECFNGALMQWTLFNPGLQLEKARDLCLPLEVTEAAACFAAMVTMLNNEADQMALTKECLSIKQKEIAEACFRASGTNISRLIIVYGANPDLLIRGCPDNQLNCLREAGFFLVSDSMDVPRAREICAILPKTGRDRCLEGVANGAQSFGKDSALHQD